MVCQTIINDIYYYIMVACAHAKNDSVLSAMAGQQEWAGWSWLRAGIEARCGSKTLGVVRGYQGDVARTAPSALVRVLLAASSSAVATFRYEQVCS